jgi:hypothetical protein
MTVKAGLLYMFIAICILPSSVIAQGVGVPPPPCCDKEPPPPPPGGNSVLPAGEIDIAIPQLTMQDSVLLVMGLTRAEFLDRTLNVYFPDQSLDLIIPIIAPPESATISGGGTSGESANASTINTEPLILGYFRIGKSLVPPETVNTLDLIYVTDGQVFLKVVFIKDTSPE